ncbi:MAG TPA: TMEM175 family protein [bacterium]|nr:TMEM175 family protein [bacterium]
MSKNRLEAFSDGVIAIILTIMVLNLQAPQGSETASLVPLLPRLAGYLLSFVFMGIYWANHHHLLQAAQKVNGAILWANLHLLFWLSLTPLTTAWMSQNHFASLPTACYGVVLLLSAVAYYILVRTLIAHHGKNSTLAQAIGQDFKGKISVVLYVLAIPLAFDWPGAALGIYVLVAVIWLVPDRRIERKLST